MESVTNFRILIIDDNPEIHSDFIKILTRNPVEEESALEEELFDEENKKSILNNMPHFEIDTATQGEEGFNYIKEAAEQGNPYSLAFVDIRMPPGWDGVETIKHIWKVDRDIQIVICTAHSDYSWQETIQRLGGGDNLLVLKKPFDNIAVRQLAYTLTKKWQSLHKHNEKLDSLEQQVQEKTGELVNSLFVMQSALEATTDGIVVFNQDSDIIEFNKKFIDMWHIPKSLLEEKYTNSVLDYMLAQLATPDILIKALNNLPATDAKSYVDIIEFNDGKVIEFYSQPYRSHDKVAGRILSFSDITHRVSLEKKIYYQTTHDSMTDLPNRMLLSESANKLIEKSEGNIELYLIFVNIDKFSAINGNLGYEVGDTLIKNISNRLRDILPDREDILASFGGDEFVMLITHPLENIEEFLKKIAQLIEKPFSISDEELTLTASIGVCHYPTNAKNYLELLHCADLSLHQAKENDSQKYLIYSKELEN